MVKESAGTIHFDDQSVCLSVCPSVHLAFHMSISRSVVLSLSLVGRLICLLICLSSASLAVCLSESMVFIEVYSLQSLVTVAV